MNHAGEGKSDLITFYEIHQGKTAKILISNVKVNYQMFTFLVKCLLIRMNTCLKCVKLVLFFAAIFKSLTSDLDEFIMALGGKVQLHLVFGDITNETTDVVVNTTDFTNFHNGI